MTPTESSSIRSSDLPPGLQAARWLWRAVLLGSVLALFTVAGHYALRAGVRGQAAGRWMYALDQSMPALYPSGSPLRFPESALPAVDTRLTPMDMDLDGHTAAVVMGLTPPDGKTAP